MKNNFFCFIFHNLSMFLCFLPRSFLSSVFVVYSYDKDDTQRSKPLLAQVRPRIFTDFLFWIFFKNMNILKLLEYYFSYSLKSNNLD